MGDKSPPKSTHPFLKRSSTNVGVKTNTNKTALKSQKLSSQLSHLSNINKNTPNLLPSVTNSNDHVNVNNPQKTFTETTANVSFSKKKNQAIIFNTIDGIPQIECIKSLSQIINPSNIKFASRISNNRFCVYFSNANIVNNILINNPTITLNNHNITIRRLENQSKRIIISNVSFHTPI